MAMLTVRNLDESLKSQLRIRAAEDGCSMEEEVRKILRAALTRPAPIPASFKGIGSRMHQRVKELTGGGEFELPPRSMPRPPPDFAGDGE